MFQTEKYRFTNDDPFAGSFINSTYITDSKQHE